MADNREWMYSGWKRGRPPTEEWVEHTKEFLDRAFSMPSLASDGQIKCPCSLCRNFVRQKFISLYAMCQRIGMSIPPEIHISIGNVSKNWNEHTT
ncbi:hypothetical protein ACP70R_044376 [Stipagrostis hirtigluma subsp. patula]